MSPKSIVVRKDKEEFPIEIKQGAIVFNIYESTNKKGYTSYVVAYSLKGQRFVKSFAELDQAKKEPRLIAGQIAAGDQAGMHLRGEDRVLSN